VIAVIAGIAGIADPSDEAFSDGSSHRKSWAKSEGVTRT
jgi:hypothetical protein